MRRCSGGERDRLEWNVVLSGSAEECDGSLWLPGDLLLRETDTIHGYRSLAGEPLLFAILQEGGLEILRDPPVTG